MGLKLQRPVSIRGAEEVCPLEDFGEADLVQGNDDGTHRLLAANDENFDGFAVGMGVAVELEGEFEVDWPGRFGIEDASTVGGGGVGFHEEAPKWRQNGCQSYSVSFDFSFDYVNPLDAGENIIL